MPSPEERPAPSHAEGPALSQVEGPAPSLVRGLRLGELGLLGTGGLLALAFHFTLPSKLPDEADYRRAGEEIASAAQPGDAVLLHPWWTERARLFVPESVEVAGYLGSEQDPLTAHPRIWLISQRRLPRAATSDFERAFSPGRAKLGETKRFGTIELTLYRNDRHRPVLFSAAGGLASARVYIDGPGGRADCSFDGRSHRCPNGVSAATEIHEVVFRPHRCVYLRPPGGDARTVVELPGVRVGEKLALEGGLVWDRPSWKGPNITPLRLGVEDASTGRTLLQATAPVGLEQPVHAEAPAAGLPQTATLRLWVQSDSAEARETCVELVSYGPPPALAQGNPGASP
ncbi:MAG: hypothetical protein HYZ28_14880 [Myxococcales bacterium]|nr:hypothetical protein [Myxococcales bacterium]